MFTQFSAVLFVLTFAASTWGMDCENEEGFRGISIRIPAYEDEIVDVESRNRKENIEDDYKGKLRKNERSSLIRDLSALNCAPNYLATLSLQRETSGSLGCAIPGFSEPHDSPKKQDKSLLKESENLSQRKAFLETINGLLGDQEISGSPVFQSLCEQNGLYQLVFTLERR